MGTKVTIKAPGGKKSAIGAKAPPFSVLSSPQPAFDAEATTHEALNDAIGGECATERMMRSVLCGWKDEAGKTATIERLAEFEDDFSGAPDGMTVKVQGGSNPAPKLNPAPNPAPDPAPNLHLTRTRTRTRTRTLTWTLTLTAHRSPLTAHRSPLTSHLSPSPSP